MGYFHVSKDGLKNNKKNHSFQSINFSVYEKIICYTYTKITFPISVCIFTYYTLKIFNKLLFI